MINFGLVEAIDTEAIGEPGARTFRVRAVAATSHAALWLEKEQLAALGRAVSKVLAERAPAGRVSPRVHHIEQFDANPAVDLQVARLGLDFDADQQRLVMLVDDAAGMERGETPSFRMEIGRADAMGLVDSIARVVAAGRPLCPLCNSPLEGEGAHFCPGSNGHSKDLPLPGEQPDAPTL